jgi:hypothetical protein
MADPHEIPTNLADRSLRSTVGRESTTFGFSILVTVTFGVVQHGLGTPGLGELFLYAIGAVLSFTVLEAIGSRGFRRTMPQHGTRTVALGTALNLCSVLGGLGVALGVVRLHEGSASWAVAPFLGGVAYLLLEAAETAFAERVASRRGTDVAEEMTT